MQTTYFDWTLDKLWSLHRNIEMACFCICREWQKKDICGLNLCLLCANLFPGIFFLCRPKGPTVLFTYSLFTSNSKVFRFFKICKDNEPWKKSIENGHFSSFFFCIQTYNYSSVGIIFALRWNEFINIECWTWKRYVKKYLQMHMSVVLGLMILISLHAWNVEHDQVPE